MHERPKWQQQCDAARTIKERFGVEKALGYLLGEKLLQMLRDADVEPTLEPEILEFVTEARAVFTPAELRQYFSGPRAVGALGHVLDVKGLELFRTAGAIQEDVAASAQDAIRFERMRQLLLAD